MPRTRTVRTPPAYLERRLRELSVLAEMNREIHGTRKIRDLLDVLVEKAVIGLNFERGLIYLLDGDYLRCAACLDRVNRDRAATIVRKVGFRLDETSVETLAVRQGKTLYVRDAALDPRMSHKFMSPEELAKHEYCAVPLYGRDGILGVFTADKFYSKDPISPEDVESLELFAGHISIAVENAQLYEGAEDFNRVLQEKVEERTAELASANQRLAEKMQELAVLHEKLEQENSAIKNQLQSVTGSAVLIGEDAGLKAVMDLVRKVAPTAATVMIHGETGTGKELVARAIHGLSPRRKTPLITVNCAAIPDDLLESELFGHERGAFTGAHRTRMGRFELANGSTIFLDEIGEISERSQAKLLRVLQESELQRLGSEVVIKVDVRVIAATNRDLQQRVRDGGFRADLFYRLNVFPIVMPPLRDRPEDIEELARFFAQRYSKGRREDVTLGADAVAALRRYPWPGNVRELENVVERMVILSDGGAINRDDVPDEIRTDRRGGPVTPLREALKECKRELVQRALAEGGGRQAQAAALLGLPRSNFSRLLKALDLR